MNYAELVENEFRKLFNEQPIIVRSPGRVNLIGEHTDYNMGYVLPAAIDKAIYFAISARQDQQCRLQALDLNEEHQFTLNRLVPSQKGWPNYLMGVVDQFIQSGHTLQGFNCVFGGDIPIGAGLSSSAAIEAGLAFALNQLFAVGLDGLSLARLSQKAENEFVGVQCGIMDQFVNLFGRENNALRIDCRSLEFTYYPFDFPDVSVVLFDTGVSHSLASSEYNRRREECNEAVSIIRRQYPEVVHLRDATTAMVEERRESMPETIYRRCKYVVEENKRVLQACKFLEKGDLASFGSLMLATHSGLRDDFEVSCRELDYLVDVMKDDERVHGSRMMGGGFGGCTINIIENEALEQVCNVVAEKYKRKFNIDPETYVTSIGAGTNMITVKETSEL